MTRKQYNAMIATIVHEVWASERNAEREAFAYLDDPTELASRRGYITCQG
jgi:hypothetical protein